MNTTSTLRLDRDAIDDNLQLIKRLVGPNGAVCGVVKADAYGVGAARIVPRMVAAELDMLAVYSLKEAVEISEWSGSVPILVLMGVHELDRGAATVNLLARDRLHLVVHDLGQLASLEVEATTFGMVLPLHLELDTGMGRGGCSADEAGMMIERIAANPRLELHGIMTHFADPAGERKIARSQRSQVLALVEKHREHIPSTCRLHAAATGGLDEASLRLDMVRVGLAWTGLVEELLEVGVDPSPLAALRPVLSLWSHIVNVRHVEAGFKVGYGSHWQAKRRSTIGLVPVGYAHGLPASRPGQHHRVVVHTDQGPRDVPVIGAVNMDQISVDLTDIGAIEVGVAVEVMSNDRTSPAFLARVASRAGVSPYALLTGLDPRLPRVMVAGHDAHVVTQSPVTHASGLSLGQP